MKKLIWSNKKNQNDDFDQDNKVKLLWKKMSDFYEEKKSDFYGKKKSDFHTDCFLIFKMISVSVHWS